MPTGGVNRLRHPAGTVFRLLCDHQYRLQVDLAGDAHPVPGNRTGAPGSHQRTWEEKDGGAAPTKAFMSISRFSYSSSESIRKNHFQPRYAGANLGHPSRGQGLAGSRESGGERTANRLTELKSFLFSLAIGESTAPHDKGEGGGFYWEPSARMEGKKQQVLGKPGQAG